MSLASMERAIGQVEGKLDSVIRMLENDHDRLNDHGARLGRVERRIYAIWIIGPIALALAGAAAAAAAFYQKLKGL